MIKRKFQSYCKAVMVAIVALVFALAGFIIAPSSNVADAAGERLRVDFAAEPADGTDYIIAGGTINLTVRVSDIGINSTWSAISVNVYPTDPDVAQYLSADMDNMSLQDGFENTANYVNASSDGFASLGFMTIGIGSQIKSEVSTSTPFVTVVPIKVSKDLPAEITSIGFMMDEENDYDSNVSANKGTAEYWFVDGDFALPTPTSVNVSKALSGANISGINVGSSAGSLVAATGSGNNYSCSSTVKSKDFYVLPVIETASSGNASWSVNGIAGAGTTPVKVTLGNGASTAVTVTVQSEDKKTTNNFTLTVNHEFPRLSGITFNVNNPDVTMNGFDSSTPFSEEDSEFTVNIPTSSATSSTGNISLTPTVLTGYGTQSSITVLAKSNLTAMDATSTGVALDVRNIRDNATLTLRVTSASGLTTKDYKLTFKVFSIDTSIRTFTVNSNGLVNNDTAQADGINSFYFFLHANTSGDYFGTMNITTGAANATVTVNGDPYNATTSYGRGTYSVVVTAPAGNTKTYSVVFAQEISQNVLTELWFKHAKLEGVEADGFKNIFNENTPNSKYDDNTYTYTGKYLAEWQLVIVNFRFEMPVGQSATVLGDMIQGQTVEVDGKTYTTFYMNLLDSQGGAAVSASFSGSIVVGSGATDRRTYTFNISVVENKKDIEDIVINNVSNQPISGFSFDKETTSYTLSVPYAISTLNFRVTTNASFARVHLNKNSSADSSVMERNTIWHTAIVQLSLGLNKLTLYAVADNDTGESGTVYTLNITRNSASSVATLASLSIVAYEADNTPFEIMDNSTPERTFSSSKETYLIVDASLNATSVFVNAIATDPNASIKGNGNIQLQANAGSTMQVITIEVTSEDGKAKKTYTVNIAKEETALDDANFVNNIAVIAGDENKMPGFFSDQYRYEITVPYSIERVYVEVSATTLNLNGGIVGAGYKALGVGLNEVVVYAISQSGIPGHEYRITITRLEPRGNVSLDRLLIDDIDKQLEEGVYNYTITRSKNEERNIKISASSADKEALVTIQRGTITASGTGSATRDFRVERGETITITITVSLDGNSSQYTLIVTRIADDASLNSLTVELNATGNFVPLLDRDLKPIDAFNPNVRDYYLTIPFDTTSMIISAVAVDETANIRGNGLRQISTLFGSQPGQEKVQIAVIPIRGDIVLYSITVTRMAARTSATDAVINIAQIAGFADEYAADLNLYGEYKVGGTVSVLDFDIDFGGDKYDYIPTYKIFYNSELQDDGDGVYLDDITLDYGLNVVNIEITATDNITKRTIVILVTRVQGGVISATVDQIGDFETEFNNEQTDYYYTVGNKVDKLDFNFKVEDGYTYVVDESANALQEGLNNITVKVYDKEGIESTINLHVFREGKPTTSSTLLIVTVVISVIEAMLLAAAVVVVIMKTNSRNNTKKNNDAE